MAKGAKPRVSDIVLSRRCSCHTQRNTKSEVRNFLELVHSSDPLRAPAIFSLLASVRLQFFTAAGVDAILTFATRRRNYLLAGALMSAQLWDVIVSGKRLSLKSLIQL